MYFEYNLDSSGDISDPPVYLHLDIDNFEPFLMCLDQENDPTERTYVAFRMVPPNRKVIYFYSNPIKGILTLA